MALYFVHINGVFLLAFCFLLVVPASAVNGCPLDQNRTYSSAVFEKNSGSVYPSTVCPIVCCSLLVQEMNIVFYFGKRDTYLY
jgi:hypothetical protein